MNSQDLTPEKIVNTIKAIISNHAAGQESISLNFFTERKGNVIAILQMLNPLYNNVDTKTLDNYYETAVKEYTSVFPVDIDPSSSLTKKGFQTWLTEERKKQISKDYIDRYLKYLRSEGRSENVISEISRSSEAILSKLVDPQSNTAFYTKGLVVGSVQSGKTGNFNAVINRAIDAGYNLVIILSGIMEDLRSQTQLRLELDVIGEGAIGKNLDQQGPKGTGKEIRFGVQGNSTVPQVFSITSHRSDFRRTLLDASFSLNHKNLLVCKKNTAVLKNLLIWLSDYLDEYGDQHNIPLLIVDDEADNASLNNLGHKGREYASIINGHIRAILALFSRKTYLGYTATPFANVLQDQNEPAQGQWQISYRRDGETVTRSFNQVDNIFPKDFIELLSPPSNYIGARQIFDTIADPNARKIPLVEPVDDHYGSFPVKVVEETEGARAATKDEIEEAQMKMRSPRKDDLFPIFLPDSLKDAIECFILATAIRLKRRPAMANSKLYNPHNTMLIHVSRFTEWQNRTRELVQAEVSMLIERIGTELPSAPDSIYAKLEKTWNKYYAAIIDNIRTYLPDGYVDEFLDGVSFNDIKPLLPQATKDIEVKAINSFTRDKLVYTTDTNGNGKKYIAVGGNRLSRGFTLEGLTINYFIRDTNYADTLLQMGRWFGYRPGYIDCCKLFTTWDSIEKFNAATCTIEELELEFKKMHRLGKTPDDFILRVRTHPGVLKITRPSILKNTEEVNWSYQDTLVQTTQFDMDDKRINIAWSSLKSLFKDFEWTHLPKRGFFMTEIDTDTLLCFLDCPNTFHDFGSELQQIKSFLRLCIENGKLRRWRIAVKATGTGSCLTSAQTGLPSDLQLSVRSGPSEKHVHHRKQLLEKGVFTGSGKSANILSAGKDMSLWLDDEEVLEAERDFVAEKTSEFESEGKKDAAMKASKITKPERIYRERMSDDMGLLVIYLMDLRYVFSESDEKLWAYKTEKDIDVTVPLIGYAIGFPPISTTIGGTYVRGKYNIDEDEPQSEEFDEEVLNAQEEAV